MTMQVSANATYSLNYISVLHLNVNLHNQKSLTTGATEQVMVGYFQFTMEFSSPVTS